MVAFSKSGGMDGGAGEVGRVAGVALNPVTVAFTTTLDALVRNYNGVKRGQFQNSKCKTNEFIKSRYPPAIAEYLAQGY